MTAFPFDIDGFASMHSVASSRYSLSLQEQQTTLCDSARRRFLVAVPALVSWLRVPPSGNAQEQAVEFSRQTKDFGYSLELPDTLSQPSNKPLKTHFDEINFNGDGLQVGITVDPVRINSLEEFGTPGEVAARVVTAEVNRDGVFEVTLLEDPLETPDKAYVLIYLSRGKRGNKYFVCKIYVENQKLYVLTGQVMEDEYSSREKELMAIVDSFRVS